MKQLHIPSIRLNSYSKYCAFHLWGEGLNHLKIMTLCDITGLHMFTYTIKESYLRI